MPSNSCFTFLSIWYDDNPMGRSLSPAYHLVALLNARFAKSDMARLFTNIFCIARELFLMSFSFGLSLDDRVLSGVISINGGNVIELPLVTVLLVIGDTVVIPTVNASTTLGGGGLSSLHCLPCQVRGGPPSASRRPYSPYLRICTPASPQAPSTLGSAIGTRWCARCACPHTNPFLTC